MEHALSISGLTAGLVSVVLGVIAIAISLYFYTQSKNTEIKVSGLLEAIRAQTDALQRIAARQMDRLIRGVTEQPQPDFAVVYEMIGALKEIPTTVVTLLQAPSSSAKASEQEAQAWRREAIKGYVCTYYYAAVANIATQWFLPPIEILTEGDLFKQVIDSSHADFIILDRWFLSVDQNELKQNPVYQVYREAFDNWRNFVKDSMRVYADRAASAAAAQSAKS